jgi:hypothetical protein
MALALTINGRHGPIGTRPEVRIGRNLLANGSDDDRQRLSLDKLHGKVMDRPFAADGIYGRDVAMVKLSSGLDLVLEAPAGLLIQISGMGQNLERDAPAQRELHRFVDNAHAASADLAKDTEVA